jgi:uncharacterized protein (TIGR03437 family)
VVYGTNLGPATIVNVTKFPLSTTLGGTSITVTVANTTVDAIMYYSLSTQVSAVLPSRTPTGAGTIKVTYNGQSATAPIVVVQNNIGIFTVSQSGTGDAIAFVNSDSGLITPTHAANPDDVVVFWGTGLGPVTSDETQPAVQADMTNIPLHVFIGGKEANIVFRGRNACCTSIDTVYVTIPQGLSGCAVSVNMQIGNITGNATTIAVANNGRTCTPINQDPTVGGTGTHAFGGFVFNRQVVIIPANGPIPGSSTKVDTVGGSFAKITFSSAPPLGSQIDVNSYGSCSVSLYSLNGKTINPPSPNKIQFLDAGASIGLAAPFGNRSIPRTTPAAGIIAYLLNLDQTATTLTAGQYTFTGTSGPDVGAFTATYIMPTPFVWTNQGTTTTVNRANGATINWTGGDPAGYVIISGLSTSFGATAASSVGVAFTCTARVADGTFTVPPVVLLALPPSGVIPGTGITSSGTLTVTSVSTPQSFPPPPGIEGGGISSSFSYSGSVTYQ